MTRTPVGRARRGPGILTATIAYAAVLAVAIACGPTTPPPSAAASQSAAASPVAAGADGSPAGSADASATPRPTAWPGNAVLGIDALGVADGQILAAINDFNKAIATEDLVLMRKAANGLAGLDVLLPNMAKIDIFEPMRSFADRYGAAITAISSAARDLRTAIDAHDGPGITSSSQALVSSLSLYAAVQPELAAWVEQSTEQRRLLLK
jgi:hypothetical protein